MTSNRNTQKKPQPIAIVGMGCMFAGANDLKGYWRQLRRGEDAIGEVPETHWTAAEYFDPDPKKPDHVYCTRGGFLSPVNFDPVEFGIPPSVIEATDTSQLLGLMAATQALNDAGYGSGQKGFDRSRTSVIIGVTGTQELVIPLSSRLGHPVWRKALDDARVPEAQAEEVVHRIAEAYVPWQEASFPGLLGNVVAGRIANRLDLGGTNCVVDAACASSFSAVNLAMLELEGHRSDMVITGGVDTLNDIFMHMCFAKTQVLSVSGDARPFSAEADGTVLGEGVGLVVLKRLADAEADGDRIYAVIRAMGTSSDGKAQSIYAPRAEGQIKALDRAYAGAGIEPATVGLIEAHGTGTRVGDAVEFNALKTFFNHHEASAGRCAVGSVKSMIGHTKAAAGAAGLIKAALAVYHKVLPPTLKAEAPDPDLEIAKSPFYLNAESRPWGPEPSHPRRCGVSAFGFGGSNFHLVLEENDNKKREVAWDGSVEIAAFSADTHDALKTAVARMIQAVADDPGEICQEAAASRLSFSHQAPFRLLVVLEKGDAPVDVLEKAGQTLADTPPEQPWQTEQAWYGTGPKDGDMAFLFPGQGSQYVGMGKDLACCFPEIAEALEKAETAFDAAPPLWENLYPRPVAKKAEAKENEDRLRSTDVAQPAIGAVSLGMMRILERFNVRPDAVAGHSYGELTALNAAGRLTTDAFFAASVARGRCMAAAGKGKVNGAMLAVRAPLSDIDELIRTEGLDVVLANRNNPTQGVLSGSIEAIEAAAAVCSKKKIRTVRLPVAAAFHSPLVESARKPFTDHLARMTLAPGRIPVFANTTAEPYPSDADLARELLANQMVRPVDFNGIVENLYSSGVRTFVEVGPKPVLTGLIRATLKGRKAGMAAMDAGAGKRSGLKDLARVLAMLAAKGRPVDLAAWETAPKEKKRAKMRLPITGTNYRGAKKPVKKSVAAPEAKRSSETLAAKMPAPATRPPSAPVQNQASIPTASAMTAKESPIAMAPPAPPAPQWTGGALQTVQEGLKSMQDLQARTAQAHEKFLETQAQAGQALQQMMHSIGTLLDPGAAPVPTSPPAAAPPHPQPMPAAIEPAATPAPDPAPELPRSATTVAETGTVSNQTALTEALMAVVGRLTGYPVEMLTPDMDMEADLGIDSIKRVEILSTLEEELPDLPPVSPEMIGEIKSLGEIVAYLIDHSPDTPAFSPAPETTPLPSPTPAAGAGEIETALVAVVAELTGYPEEMLQPEMDLESDLGIDSIKRVEILSSLEERLPHLPSVSPEMMADLKTLGQIIAFLGQAPSQSRDVEPAAPARQEAGSILLETLQAVIAELTGYPEEMLTPEMDMESDLGIDSIKRVEILSALEERLPHLPSVSPEMVADLKTLGQIATHLSGVEASPAQSETATTESPARPPSTDSPEPEPRLGRKTVTVAPAPPLSDQRAETGREKPVLVFGEASPLTEAICHRLAASDLSVQPVSAGQIARAAGGGPPLPAPCGVVLLAGKEPEWMATAFDLARLTGAGLQASGSSGFAFFTTITRIDGAFGFLGGTPENPCAGALAGLAKTAALEWPDVDCKALDILPDWSSPVQIAEAVVREILYAAPDSPGEIGLSPEKRLCLVLDETGADADPGKPDLEPGDVVVVSGGAKGVTAAAALALAEAVRPTLVLLGRSPLPEPEPDWLRSVTDPARIKRALLEHWSADSQPSPKDIEKAYREAASGREIQATLAQLSSMGIQVEYHCLDIRHKEAVARCIEGVRRSLGPVRAVIHGAGILCDRLIVDKTADQFKTVFDTKVAGLANLVSAIDPEQLKHLVLFSSVAARFGNAGQSDYAMANEAMNKMALSLAGQQKGWQVRSINWGPWAGGMVSDALKRQFEKRGIDLIPLAAGARAMVEEMATFGPVEIVIGGSLAPAPAKPLPDAGFSTAVTHAVDLAGYPVLDDHRLKGLPVVPLAIMAEWMAHGALHHNPGLALAGLDDLRLLSGIKMDRDRKTFQFMSGKAIGKGGRFHVPVQIQSTANGRPQVHARATALLGDLPRETVPAARFQDVGTRPYSRGIEEAYETVLFHGRSLRGIEAVLGCCDKGMQAAVQTAPLPAEWIADPLRSRWIADPLVLDSAFQMAILWSEEIRGLRCLPSYIGAYRQYRRKFPKGRVKVAFRIEAVTDRRLTGDFLVTDPEDQVVATLTGFEAVMDPELTKAFKPQRAA